MTALSCMLLAVLPMPGCSNPAKGEDDRSSVMADRPDKELKRLMRAIADGDAPAFASMCDYPILREYPLRAIEDSTAMVEYFPVLADDSLRSMMRNSKPEDWEYYGWRGWNLGESRPIWYEEGVEFIDYESAAEKGLRKMLSRREMMTLKPEYRHGWMPVATLVEEDGEKIFRIDRRGDEYRLMGFDRVEDTAEDPALLLDGTMHTEGSAQLRYFSFKGKDGTIAEYMPDGEPPLRIWITRPGSEKKTVVVSPAYWRDYVKGFGKDK